VEQEEPTAQFAQDKAPELTANVPAVHVVQTVTLAADHEPD